MNVEAANDAAVNGRMTVAGGTIDPKIEIAGPISLFEQTHGVKDSAGKSASVHVRVANAPDGLEYGSMVLPREGVVSAQPWISAEQWLTVPKADSIKATASSSHDMLSASAGIEEVKSSLSGDYVALTGYNSKAYASAEQVAAIQTAIEGSADSIKVYGTARDRSETYSINTQHSGILGESSRINI